MHWQCSKHPWCLLTLLSDPESSFSSWQIFLWALTGSALTLWCMSASELCGPALSLLALKFTFSEMPLFSKIYSEWIAIWNHNTLPNQHYPFSILHKLIKKERMISLGEKNNRRTVYVLLYSPSLSPLLSSRNERGGRKKQILRIGHFTLKSQFINFYSF